MHTGPSITLQNCLNHVSTKHITKVKSAMIKELHKDLKQIKVGVGQVVGTFLNLRKFSLQQFSIQFLLLRLRDNTETEEIGGH